jgi:hypothetical protein
MWYLIMVGIAELIFGLLLFFAPGPFRAISGYLDRVVLDLDEKLEPYRRPIGFLEIALAAWLYYIAVTYPMRGVMLQPFWVMFLVFGILYLFFPGWMSWVSSKVNKKVSLEQHVINSRQIIGIILIFVSLYIFYLAYLAAQVVAAV